MTTAARTRKTTAPKPAPAPKAAPAPKPEPEQTKLTNAQKRSLTPKIAAALQRVAAEAPERPDLAARYVVDAILRYLPAYADCAADFPELPSPTPFKSAKSDK